MEEKQERREKEANEVAQYCGGLEFKSLQGFRCFLQSHQANVMLYPHFLALHHSSVTRQFDTVQSELLSASLGNYTTDMHSTERETDVQKEMK